MCLVMLKEIIKNEIRTKSCDCNFFKNLTQSIVFISNHSVNDSAGSLVYVLLRGGLVHSAIGNPPE